MVPERLFTNSFAYRTRMGVFGNNKLFRPGRGTALQLVEGVAKAVAQERLWGISVGIAPTMTWLSEAARLVSSIPGNNVNILSQSVGKAVEGAWTTEVSPLAVKEAGAIATLLNHHEQRTQFGGITPELNLRIAAALQNGLDVILCIGEPKQHPGKTQAEIYEQQLMEALGSLTPETVNGHLLVALEPGSLIGEEIDTLPVGFIEDGVNAIYRVLQQRLPQMADLPFIYGGGVTAANVEGLIQHFKNNEKFMGTLPGTASSEIEGFVEIARKAHRLVVPEEQAKAFIDLKIDEQPASGVAVAELKRSALPTFAITKPEFSRTQSVEEIAQVMMDRPVRVGLLGFGEVARAAVEMAAVLGLPVDISWVANRSLSDSDAYGRASKLEFLRSIGEVEQSTGPLGPLFTLSGKGLRTQRYHYLDMKKESVKVAAEHFRGQSDIVMISASQLMKDRSTIDPFLSAGSQLVMLTSMSPVDDVTVVPGVNDPSFSPGTHRIMALGSCTGNGATTVAAAVESFYGRNSIKGGFIVTPHSVTPSQNLTAKGLDPKTETSINNTIRTKTGLSDIFAKDGFFPAAAATMAAVSYRVPTEYASALENFLIVEGAKPGDEKKLRDHFIAESKGARFAGMLRALPTTRGTRYNMGPHMVEIYNDSVKIFPMAVADRTSSILEVLASSIGSGIAADSKEAQGILALQALLGGDLGIVQIGASFGNVPGYAANVIRGALFHGLKLRQAGLLA